ncbi:MAG: hypothetical protein AAGF31_06665 [Planctomycetota bacterium]
MPRTIKLVALAMLLAGFSLQLSGCRSRAKCDPGVPCVGPTYAAPGSYPVPPSYSEPTFSQPAPAGPVFTPADGGPVFQGSGAR